MLLEDAVEVLKHAGEGVTNLARGPGYLIFGHSENTDKLLDWPLLVPLEFVSNSVEMKGFANMADYEAAFAQKGVIGSLLELGGSTYILYEAIEEAEDECDDDNDDHRGPAEGQPKPEPAQPSSSASSTWYDATGAGDGFPSGTVYLGPDGRWYVVP
jgi:hypothetical protein